MKKYQIFIVRLILSIAFAFVISRFFFETMSGIKVLGLGIILLGLAYLFEYARERNKGG